MVLFHVRSAGGTLPVLAAWKYRLLGRGSAASRRLSNSACAHCTKPCITSEREARCSQTVKITKIKKIRCLAQCRHRLHPKRCRERSSSCVPSCSGVHHQLQGVNPWHRPWFQRRPLTSSRETLKDANMTKGGSHSCTVPMSPTLVGPSAARNNG